MPPGPSVRQPAWLTTKPEAHTIVPLAAVDFALQHPLWLI
jgi:hypothetical protein